MQPIYNESRSLSVCQSSDMRVCGWTLKYAVYSWSGSGSGNRSFLGKKTRGNPFNSIGGNEPRGRGSDLNKPRGPKVGPPTGNMRFTCILSYLSY